MFTLEDNIKIVNIKDIKTQLKDGKGKLGLVLECIGYKGSVSEMEIPDIDLNIPELEVIREDNVWCGIRVPSKNNGYIGFRINEDKDGNLFTLREIERTVTKEQLEKELGYKLNIK